MKKRTLAIMSACFYIYIHMYNIIHLHTITTSLLNVLWQSVSLCVKKTKSILTL